jgi:hypothetical protein
MGRPQWCKDISESPLQAVGVSAEAQRADEWARTADLLITSDLFERLLSLGSSQFYSSPTIFRQ